MRACCARYHESKFLPSTPVHLRSLPVTEVSWVEERNVCSSMTGAGGGGWEGAKERRERCTRKYQGRS